MSGKVWRLALAFLVAGGAFFLRAGVAHASGLAGGQWLYPGQYLLSGSGLMQLIMQTDGNLVLYYNYGASTPVWSTGTGGSSVEGAVMQTDGNFVIYNTGGAAIWASNTSGHPGAYLIDQNDGNQVIYVGSSAIWATSTMQDTPGSGYWSGSDSNAPTATRGSGFTFVQPAFTSLYAGYFAEVDNFQLDLGCPNTPPRATNFTDSAAAHTDWSVNPHTMGTALYYYMGGPGADPSYNGTSTEAQAWGQQQAIWAVNTYNAQGPQIDTPLIVMDIEQPYATGWNDVTYGCGGDVMNGIPTSLDRATFNGFWNYIYYDTTAFYPGVYSSTSYWTSIFGTGSDGSIPNTFEWTNQVQTYSTNVPGAWCYGSSCASWFGGTNKQLAWQWAISETDNSVGDLDQIDMCTWSSAC